MPAIYYRHELIEERAYSMWQKPNVFSIPRHLVEHTLDVIHLIIVHKGKAWAARKILKNKANSVNYVLVQCVHYSDEITGKQILLKHLLQGE